MQELQNNNIIINNVFCFINSAKCDYPKETLKDVAFSFYTHEDIKAAKTEICNLLRKDIQWRRDPEKKKKDLSDVIEFHEELMSKRNNFKFVCTSYKAMPLLGMEMIAPLLLNLTTEINKINELLPKIVDIKSEVLNTADTVRQVRVEMADIKTMFTNAVDGMQAAAGDIANDDANLLQDLHSFRKSLTSAEGSTINEIIRYENEVVPVLDISTEEEEGKKREAISLEEDDAQNSFVKDISEDLSNLVTNKRTGAISKVPENVHSSSDLYSEVLKRVHNRKFPKNTAKQVKSINVYNSKTVNSNQTNNNRVKGVRKGDGCPSFKSVKRSADVFLNRVHSDTSIAIIRDYIKDTFNVGCINIEQIKIKTQDYNAFKITVPLHERDLLFRSELWPEDVVVGKYYNRNKKSFTDNYDNTNDKGNTN